MKNVTKVNTTHAKYFGIVGATASFYALIDRLQKHSEQKHPHSKWSNDVYYGIAFQWLGKQAQLEQKVFELEKDMETNKKTQNANTN